MPTVYDFFVPFVYFLGSPLSAVIVNYLGPVLVLASILGILKGIIFNV